MRYLSIVAFTLLYYIFLFAITALATLGLFNILLPLDAHSASTCPPNHSYTEFLATNSDLQGLRVFNMNEEGVANFLNLINTGLKERNQEPINADLVAVGIFNMSGSVRVGLAAFKDSCVIPASIISMSEQGFERFMSDAGITAAMLVEQKGA
jgi:hypothetical protein